MTNRSSSEFETGERKHLRISFLFSFLLITRLQLAQQKLEKANERRRRLGPGRANRSASRPRWKGRTPQELQVSISVNSLQVSLHKNTPEYHDSLWQRRGLQRTSGFWDWTQAPDGGRSQSRPTGKYKFQQPNISQLDSRLQDTSHRRRQNLHTALDLEGTGEYSQCPARYYQVLFWK